MYRALEPRPRLYRKGKSQRKCKAKCTSGSNAGPGGVGGMGSGHCAAWHHHSRNPSSRASFCHVVLPDLFFHMGQLTFGVMSCDKRCCSASVPVRLRCLKQPRGFIYPSSGMAATGRCGFCCHLFVSLFKPE